MGEGKREGVKVYASVRETTGCKWYTIDTGSEEYCAYDSMNEDDDEETDELPTPLDSGCAMIESKIYVVGGKQWDPEEYCFTKPRSKALIIFDTLSEQWIRKDSYHMNTERANPLLVPFKYDNAIRLLVFGGCKARADVWCESFDIATCKWTSLAQPPNVVTKHKLCGYARVGDALVLWSRFLFCIYHVDTNKWSEDVCLLEYNFEGIRRRTFRGPSSVAVYDKVLYWYYGEQLHGYDLSRTRWIKTPLCSFHQQEISPDYDCGEYSYTSMFLVTLDKEKLAAFWTDIRKRYRACDFMTFRTSTNPHTGLLSASQTYYSFTDIGNKISHVLTAYQPAIEDCWSENKGTIVDLAFIRDLSSTMYMESYLSFSQGLDPDIAFSIPYPPPGTSDNDDDFDRLEPESSVDPLPLLKLDEDSAAIMRKLINKNALKYCEEKEIKCLERGPTEAKLAKLDLSRLVMCDFKFRSGTDVSDLKLQTKG